MKELINLLDAPRISCNGVRPSKQKVFTKMIELLDAGLIASNYFTWLTAIRMYDYYDGYDNYDYYYYDYDEYYYDDYDNYYDNYYYDDYDDYADY